MVTLEYMLDALLFLTTITVAYFFAYWWGWWGVLPGLTFAALAIFARLRLEGSDE